MYVFRNLAYAPVSTIKCILGKNNVLCLLILYSAAPKKFGVAGREGKEI